MSKYLGVQGLLKNRYCFYALQKFAGIYRDFAGKSECGDFKFTGIACITAIPVIFEENQKKCGLFIYRIVASTNTCYHSENQVFMGCYNSSFM